ncbi:MAG: carboxymethylenebutenolidase [Micromonosporaceae bacterium]|jgi:carboxymethylenebutenolidase|nr:carboxymethylenebutenolidase [Micromonosporaceae bacterium]
MHTAMVDVRTSDGVADAYLAHPDDGHRHPAVLFYMDGIGLRPRLSEMAEQIAAHGYLVLAPNLFYRHGRAPLVADLSDLLKPENRAKLMESFRRFATSLTPEAAMRDAAAYVNFLSAHRSVTSGPIGITGYCMGGAMALRTAAAFADRVAAAASFHGGNLATDAPDSPHLLADRISAELYFGHADEDRSMTQEQITRLEAALDAAGVHYRSELYPGAAHGFTMADTAAYNAAATDRHWTNLLALLDRNLPAAG